ncbi:MAG: hypothetical protein H0T53_12230 [Herpetosiphonaceae bacterium]|nr:hypothetical protein [Herpetosiphonaceae bacterium]
MSDHLDKGLAIQLGEVHWAALHQISRVISVVGDELAQIWADEAVTIAAGDGMLTADGQPRTTGGIFFYLARQRLDADQRCQVFPNAAELRRLQQERTRQGLPAGLQPQRRSVPSVPAGPILPPFRWSEKAGIYQELQNAKGKVQSVKISLMGRPGRVVEKQDLVITMMTQMDAPKAFPKGVPAPPTTPTVYMVYIAAKQWQKVAKAIQNEQDSLIVEGFAAFDPGLEGMAVFATNVTTKVLQQQKRSG